MKSFIEILPSHPFPIHNLPYGIFSRKAEAVNSKKHIGVAIGDYILDLTILEHSGYFKDYIECQEPLFQTESLNCFMAKGHTIWDVVRRRIQSLLDVGNSELQSNAELLASALILQKSCTMYLPVEIGDYTDFYASRNHAENVGTMFRGKANALMPNWLHLPVAYHGRASSIVVSETPIRMPKGQVLNATTGEIQFGNTQKLDFEVELGFIVGVGNAQGEPIPIEKAEDHIFGAVLVNDWSARDIQQWEYQPLGPFLGKNFATAISPWVVPMAALKACENKPLTFEKPLLSYLEEENAKQFDIEIDVFYIPPHTTKAHKIASTNTENVYWTYRQMVAHHTINGCNLRTGDLLATGTISGKDRQHFGSLLELTENGSSPLIIEGGNPLSYLNFGDKIEIQGRAILSLGMVGFGDVSNYITI